MSSNSSIAALATVLTTGLAGLALSAPLALAAPTPGAPSPAVTTTGKPAGTPTSTGTPKPSQSGTPKPSQSSTAKPSQGSTAKPSQGSTPGRPTTNQPAATNTPTQAPTGRPPGPEPTNLPVGPFAESVTGPKSPQDTVRVYVSGVRSPHVRVDVMRSGAPAVVAYGSGQTSDIYHDATVLVLPPAGGWVPGGEYIVKVRAGDRELTDSFRVPGSVGSGRLTPPRNSSDPVLVTLTGQQPGTRLTADAGTWHSDESYGEVTGTVGADGTISFRVPGPKSGWQSGKEYGVTVRIAGSYVKVWDGHFTYRGGAGGGDTGGAGSKDAAESGPAGSSAAKDSSGGLAKTGQ